MRMLSIARGLPLVALVLGVLGSLTAACERKVAESQLEAYATQAKTSRATAAKGLIAAVQAGQIVPDDALTLAAAKLDNGEDATEFSGAVLDMLGAIEEKLPHAGEFELFWRRVGRLAYWSAERAYLKGRKEEAATLILAGPKRWQQGQYWERYGDHDVLAAILLVEAGRKSEAVERLRSRANLSEEGEELLKKLGG